MKAYAWEEGHQARKNGREVTANPYDRETDEYSQWRNGYLCAAA